jgi:transposase
LRLLQSQVREEAPLIFVGIDWSEQHHDICLIDQQGAMLAKRRVADGIQGVAELHGLIAYHAADPEQVTVGIETDRGLLVGSLCAAGYRVIAINPLSVDRYRDRHSTSGAKSDPGDAKVLADIVRTDAHNHRPVAGDSVLAEGVKLLSRAHHNLIWERQRHVNRLRNALREFYPQALEAFGTDLAGVDAVGVLGVAPTPELGRSLSRSKIQKALSSAGRLRNLSKRSEQIQQALRSEQLAAPALIEQAQGAVVRSTIRLIAELNQQIGELEWELKKSFEQHPDAEIYLSLPGLGTILGARVLGELGDDQTRYLDAKARKNYAGTSPITKASGKHFIALARYARNEHLFDACFLWAFSSLTKSPGARAYYDALRKRGKTHNQALRQLANRWVGVLHGCLRHRQMYQEEIAWPSEKANAA